jgi:hypothetical protein
LQTHIFRPCYYCLYIERTWGGVKKYTALLAFLLLVVAVAPLSGATAVDRWVGMGTPAGDVDQWDGVRWQTFAGGPAVEGVAYRVLSSGLLRWQDGDDFLELQGSSGVRFFRLGKDLYCKGFGQIKCHLTHHSVCIETPLAAAFVTGDATLQTTTAAEVRLAVRTGTGSLSGLSCAIGTVKALNPEHGIVALAEGGQIQLDDYTQLAKHTLNHRIMNEPPQQMVGELQIGEPIVAYGIPSAGPLQATAVFPPDGRFIFAGTYLVLSPPVPFSGPAHQGGSGHTLFWRLGQDKPETLAGEKLGKMVWEIGNVIEDFPAPQPGQTESWPPVDRTP